MKTTGTIRKITIKGVTYDAKADINITKLSRYEKEVIPTTGQSIVKFTLRSPNMEGITLGVTPEENRRLEELAAEKRPYPMSVELADGSVYRTNGTINHENYESEEGTASIQAFPDSANAGWTLFNP